MAEKAVCPECRAGKHRNCDGTAWDTEKDAPAPCECTDAEHGPQVSAP